MDKSMKICNTLPRLRWASSPWDAPGTRYLVDETAGGSAGTPWCDLKGGLFPTGACGVQGESWAHPVLGHLFLPWEGHASRECIPQTGVCVPEMRTACGTMHLCVYVFKDWRD